VSERDLAVFILQQVAVSALEHARSTAAKARRMIAQRAAAAAGFDANQFHSGVRKKRVEDADRVGATADAGEDGIGQAANGRKHLPPRFLADSPFENRAPSWGKDARPAPSPAGNKCRRRWSPNRAWPR